MALKNGNTDHKLTAEEQRKGGTNSGIARQQKKTVQKILSDYLANSVGSNENLKKIARQAGINEEQSIKELVTAACVLNTLKKGDVDKLARIAELLGEQDYTDEIKQQESHDTLIEALRERQNEVNKTE